jgi:hypothetical protein
VRRPDKVAIFIDGGFLRAILRDYFNKERIDFLKLSDELSQGCERFRTYYTFLLPTKAKPLHQRKEKEFLTWIGSYITYGNFLDSKSD